MGLAAPWMGSAGPWMGSASLSMDFSFLFFILLMGIKLP
jgi:hypothetical protein